MPGDTPGSAIPAEPLVAQGGRKIIRAALFLSQTPPIGAEPVLRSPVALVLQHGHLPQTQGC